MPPACLWRPFQRPRKWVRCALDHTTPFRDMSPLCWSCLSVASSPSPHPSASHSHCVSHGGGQGHPLLCLHVLSLVCLSPSWDHEFCLEWALETFKAGPTSSQGELNHRQRPFQPYIPFLASAPCHPAPVPGPRPSQVCWTENRCTGTVPCTGTGMHVSCLLIINLENYGFLFIFNWRIISVQCCLGFCRTTM